MFLPREVTFWRRLPSATDQHPDALRTPKIMLQTPPFRSKHHRSKNYQKDRHMQTYEGDEYANFKAFKAITEAHKFNFRCKKSDSSRYAACAHDNCPFRINVTYSSTRQCFMVVLVGGEHNCIGTGKLAMVLLPSGPGCSVSYR